ncbi:MAG: right-handed parallel beta-helix repeat-containing protein, partial [bacterium]
MKQIWTILLMLAFAQATFGQLSGPLSGVLGPSTHHVVGTIYVNFGDSLTIMPPTTLIFDGPYPFRIYGTLMAEGTESNSIVFTTYQSGSNYWQGLRFAFTSSSGSRLAYCLIEKGYATGESPYDNGGGIWCYQSSPAFLNCTVSENSASNHGGGVYCGQCSPIFTNCTLSGNAASDGGGGLYCYQSSPTFTNCTISQNSAGSGYGGGVSCVDSSPSFINCEIGHNATALYAGGVYCYGSSPIFTGCTITGNSTWGIDGDGGGIGCHHYSSPTFANCVITGNSVGRAGGGVHCEVSSPTFTSCSIAGNSAGGRGGGLYCGWNSAPILTNCAISGNAASSGGGVYC